ncbi:MAG: ABC transporter substrate-binding protein [Actinobacteria bacterium]|nr:ABC transporter substrate-binding protein [Actinomycetota bacterium]
MTDFNQLDPFRKKADPLQLDLVESFAQGKINRRHFIQRGTVLGLSLASISAIVAACGGSSSSSGGAGDAATDTGIGGGEVSDTVAAKTGGSIKLAMSPPGSEGVNAITMIDLVTYNVCAQVFEYLVRSASDLSVVPQLATEWSGSSDAKTWTFKLREGVMWQDGTPFTSADVVATMDKLVEAGNSALTGTLSKGGTTAPDDLTVVFALDAANGHFPYLVSSDNTQSQITPVAWTVKDNLKPGVGGTGPWKLDSLDVKTGAKYSRNDAWWGGKTPLDTVEFIFIEDTAAQIAAVASGEADGNTQFSADQGEVLLNDPNMNIVELKSATHRQLWMQCDSGAVMDPKVRQAIAWTFDRQKMIDKALGGHGTVANDHVMFELYPYFDSAAVEQRVQDIDKAKALLKEAGAEGMSVELPYIKASDMTSLAILAADGMKQAGIDVKLVGSDYSTFYGKFWCPAEPAKPPCVGASDIGIVDYGHRGTPDVYLNAALATNGVWNSSQYASSTFDTQFAAWSAAVDVDAQKSTAAAIETTLWNDTPVGIPYTINTLGAFNKKFQGIVTTAMGFAFLEAASQA